MRNIDLFPLVLAWPVLLVPTVLPAPAAAPVTTWIPPQAVITLEVRKPEALLDPLLGPELKQAWASLPLSEQLQSDPGYQKFTGVIQYLEGQLGTDWRQGLRSLLGGGLTVAFGPSGEALLSVDAKDEAMLTRLHEILLGFARDEALKLGQPDRVASREYLGETGWTFGPNEAHVLLGQRLLVSNRPEVLQALLDRRAQGGAQTVVDTSWYQAGCQAVGPEAVAVACLNLEAVKQHPNLQQALQRDRNPLAALLFAGARESLQQARWLAAGLYTEGDTLRLKLFTDAAPPGAEDPARFATPQRPQDQILPNLVVPRGIAGLSLFRDLHGFYAAKDQLFPERTSGLIFFENMMGIFFSGLDLTEEVLGETRPEIRLVAAAPQFDPAAGVPAVQLPAFAFILPLKDPETFGPVVEEAWQKALGLINFTRGQKALPGLIIDRLAYHNIKYTVAYYRPPDPDQAGTAHLRYNFRPSLARSSEFVILSSTDQLARDLLDALQGQQPPIPSARPATHSLLQINGDQLRAILEINRSHMVRQNMVDKGHSRQQAENDMTMLFTLLSSLKQATLTLSRESSQTVTQLDLRLRPPSAPAPAPARETEQTLSNPTPDSPSGTRVSLFP